MAVDFLVQQVRLRNSIFLGLIIFLSACEASLNKNDSIDFSVALNKSEQQITMEHGLLCLNKKPFNGILYTYYPQTKDTAEVTSYKNGKEHGEWRKFYPSGKIKEKRYFKDGRKTNDYIAWWENGQKQLHYFFVDDEYEGSCREWSSDGKLVKLMNYKRGHEEGHQQWWYTNGKVKANYIIQDGRRYGLLGTKNCINVSDSVFNQ